MWWFSEAEWDSGVAFAAEAAALELHQRTSLIGHVILSPLPSWYLVSSFA